MPVGVGVKEVFAELFSKSDRISLQEVQTMKSIFSASSEKVLNNIKNSGLLEKGDRVLVALSGGADSVFLLLVLLEIKDMLGVEICAAHLNHGIRGQEADRDELFSRQLCERLRIGFVSERVSVPEEMKKTGEGCEECARRLRYSFLDRAAKALECNKIATAHQIGRAHV